MIRKKKSTAPLDGPPVMRGRSGAGQGEAADRRGNINPLARRFLADSEPATVELSGPAGFPSATPGDADPKTEALHADSAQMTRIISHDPASGKYYIHPGSGDMAVYLQGEPVRAPTELRPGDSIRVGDLVIHFGS